ncbi:aspartyl protease family protein 2-like [Euphorbia lathyris]|uniref:aspartyl protease family protein 2-like n=1 Tax=Euphorbia lathyris TaxID=212925 RepID=UPI003313E1C0
MVFKFSLILVLLVVFSGGFKSVQGLHDHHKNSNSNISTLPGIQLTHHMSFNAVSASTVKADCGFSNSKEHQKSHSIPAQEEDEDDLVHRGKETMKLNLTQRFKPKESFMDSTKRDLSRIQTLHKRIIEKKNQNAISRLKKDKKNQAAAAATADEFSGQLTATLESGVSIGSGEYLIDVFIGTPPKHYSLILDTGSDLNWIQSVPCYDCFEQNGAFYIPQESSSYRNISCKDPRCNLVSSPNPPHPCKFQNQSCPYFYWYGDSSNTTGDFALETFTVNLTSPSGKSEFKKVENVMFGAGHWNRGLFHGAAGLLGFGRGPLSFPSQLQSKYGHSFSYCFVNRNSDINVSSKLIFGEDKDLLNHPELNYTSFVAGKENPVDTFYYVQIKSIMVGGEVVDIPEQTWELSPEGAGGTIVDSGTTLSYFAQPAYQIIKEAFLNKVKKYPIVKDFPVLEPCYNVSGVKKLEMPEFGIKFGDGAVWNFPVENYFLRLEPEEIVCLAILGTPSNALSIIGNYQQQNFHILYDTKRSRLGYAPMNCADV